MLKTTKMLGKIGGKANHLFKNTPGKLIYYMFTLFSSFLKKCDCKEHKLPKIQKIGENLFLDALLRCKTCFSLKWFYESRRWHTSKTLKSVKVSKKCKKLGKNVTFTVFTPNRRTQILYFFNYYVFGCFSQSIWVIFEDVVFSSNEGK